MIAVWERDVRADIKKYFDMVFSGESVVVSREENRNAVIISESEYNEIEKVKKNMDELLAMGE